MALLLLKLKIKEYEEDEEMKHPAKFRTINQNKWIN